MVPVHPYWLLCICWVTKPLSEKKACVQLTLKKGQENSPCRCCRMKTINSKMVNGKACSIHLASCWKSYRWDPASRPVFAEAPAVCAASLLSSELIATPDVLSLPAVRIGRREDGEPCDVLAAPSAAFLIWAGPTPCACSGSPPPNILIETSAPPSPTLLLSRDCPKDPLAISPPSSTWEYCDRPLISPVSSRRADSGAGRKLADESCIPNRLELGILLLCIPEASPASSIASLTSLQPTKYYTLITKTSRNKCLLLLCSTREPDFGTLKMPYFHTSKFRAPKTWFFKLFQAPKRGGTASSRTKTLGTSQRIDATQTY
jgi:hypothetical protein